MFRVVLAVLVIADLTSRTTDLSAHYADKGVLPRTVLVEEVLSRWAFSLNLINGEPFFQALLFWSMFLPLGAYWSVDRALKSAVSWPSMSFLSVATVGLFMQIAFVYWFTAAL